MREKEFLECVIYNRNSDVYIWYMVASWAHTKEASPLPLCVKISVTLQAKLATISSCYFCCK